MGTFFIAKETASREACERLNQAHRQHGFQLSRKLHAGGFILYLYRKLDGEGGLFVEIGPDRSACLVGQLLYRGEAGEQALRLYCQDLASGQLDHERVVGQFALIVQDGRSFRLLSDALGFFHIYLNEAVGIATSSFWALLELLPRITVDSARVYEYAWNGTTFGDGTFLKEVCRLPARAQIKFDGEMVVEKDALPRSARDGAPARKLESYVEEHVERLRRLFRDLAVAFDNSLRVSFSSGYDSRLILAGLRSAGLQPGLFVYGQEGDVDVKIAQQIAAAESLTLDVIDKTRMAVLEDVGWQSRQEADFIRFDSWRVDGIFDDGSDALDRQRRHGQGRIPLNGSLGEIYRNFFYIPDRPMALKGVVDSFFSGYAPSACTDQFRLSEYTAGLIRALQSALACDDHRVSRAQVERLYPLVRGRYWTGRDVTLNLRFGRMFFPFMQAQLIEGTADIPIRFKNHGLFESRLIEGLDPSIARYPSGYGYRFCDPPPFSHRARNWLTLYRPPWLRRYSYRLRFAKRRPFPPFLASSYLDRLMDSSMPYMRRYFRLGALHDPDVFNRIATMEYLFQRYGALEPK